LDVAQKLPLGYDPALQDALTPHLLRDEAKAIKLFPIFG